MKYILCLILTGITLLLIQAQKGSKESSMPSIQQGEVPHQIHDKFQLNKRKMGDVYRRIDKRGTCTCPTPKDVHHIRCDRTNRYRTADGTCNNLQRPLWGSAQRAFRRHLDADYADNRGQPRADSAGDPLPSARYVSWQLCPDQKLPSPVFTSLLVFLGQFVDHDLTLTGDTALHADTGSPREVTCGHSGCETSGAENKACLPISIPANDSFYNGQQCIHFVRSGPVLPDHCAHGRREQRNEITAYLDASQVYGSCSKQAALLRDSANPRRGKLRSGPATTHGLKLLLPQHDDPACKDVNDRIRCFLSGDERVNENVILTVLHTIFNREHNRIEAQLHTMNPTWSGEKLYQESRRIVTAIMQHIVYNEYLPIILGTQGIQKFGLDLQNTGFNDAYDKTANADIANAFATAAFRFGHSQITPHVQFTGPDYAATETLNISWVFFRPAELYKSRFDSPGVDNMLRGLVSSASEQSDNIITHQVSQHLFTENPPDGIGLDLPALNIQRGRDHGLPGYNSWREWCGSGRATNFTDLFRDIRTQDLRDTLSRLYKHVDDVDLFAAGISERPMPGAQVGPTLSCIIGSQFRDLRQGDRFWYERDDSTTGFTTAQLKEIRKITFAKVICDNTDGIQQIQPRVLLFPLAVAMREMRKNLGRAYDLASLYHGESNERQKCSTIPGIDLTKWKEC